MLALSKSELISLAIGFEALYFCYFHVYITRSLRILVLAFAGLSLYV